ncbi:hypothetical protein PENSPDRAFT_651991 [Peniophora sp. CONT]|nr:hypothetical protein PENSPDRAFT_651991 [Peniophora sp. CONT]
MPRTHASQSTSPISSSPPNARLTASAAARRRSQSSTLPGFRVQRPSQRAVEQLTLRELRDLYERNARILAQPAPSTSTYVPRLQAEQAKIESRLIDLEGVKEIQTTLQKTTLKDEDMSVDGPSGDAPQYRAIDAKRQAAFSAISHDPHSLSLQKAMQLEQEAEALERERRQRAEEKRLRMGKPTPDEVLTRQEREARLWAFMNYKCSDSEDDDEDEDADDPATWFEDDQDDGRKGQNLIEPDNPDEFEIDPNIIAVDYGKVYEFRDGPGAGA